MKRILSAMGVALLALLIFTSPGHAAELVGEDVYRLPSGETIDDDLYVGASEVFIDGTVNGDLIAAAGYVEINGTVTGDVLAAGGGIVVNGNVGDDLRAAGAGLTVHGDVGGDVVLAGGGGPPGFAVPMQVGNRSIDQGILLRGAVAGDAIVVGGEADLAGNVAGDLYGGLGVLSLNGRIGGNAVVNAGSISFGPEAQVVGRLTYTTESEQASAGTVSEDVVYEAPPPQVVEEQSFASRLWAWSWRTVMVLIGFAGLGWLVLRFAPATLERPVTSLRADPGLAALYGIVAMAGLIVIPFVSALLILLIGIFWGGFPAVVLFLFLFSALALLWLFSPLVTGLWLGSRFTENRLTAMLLGVLLLALLIRIPILGWFVALASFILALGALVLSRRGAAPPGYQAEKAPVVVPAV